MSEWLSKLRYDPSPPLISSDNAALVFFVKRDLLGESAASVETLWVLPSVMKILNRQQEDGSWRYHGGNPDIRSQENYNQLETYRILGILIETHGFTREHPTIEKAAEFLIRFQTEEGDFRGIYGNQYTPNYTAAIMELLIKAGYDSDPRVERGFLWLPSVRQNDGGWTIPIRTVGMKFDKETLNAATISPDASKPFSHLVTGVVLRVFAAHKDYRSRDEAKIAGKLLASRFFQPDTYPDRRDPSYWRKFSCPFWFTDLLSSLDSLSLLGFTPNDPQIQNALEWFITQQQDNGLWKLQLLKNRSIKDLHLWIDLAIYRVLKRFFCANAILRDTHRMDRMPRTRFAIIMF